MSGSWLFTALFTPKGGFTHLSDNGVVTHTHTNIHDTTPRQERGLDQLGASYMRSSPPIPHMVLNLVSEVSLKTRLTSQPVWRLYTVIVTASCSQSCPSSTHLYLQTITGSAPLYVSYFANISQGRMACRQQTSSLLLHEGGVKTLTSHRKCPFVPGP